MSKRKLKTKYAIFLPGMGYFSFDGSGHMHSCMHDGATIFYSKHEAELALEKAVKSEFNRKLFEIKEL